MRWGLGPVFIYERLTNSRRWQTYAIRSFGVASLLVAMGTIAVSQGTVLEGRVVEEYSQFARLGESYFYAIIGMELALVMLVAPAATAGAICVDRARGTLEHLLVTDLSDAEIVLGKLAARLMPVMGLVACSWPVLAISTSLGGIDPIAVTLALAVIVAVALLGCTLALALSIWARKPYEVILALYAFWTVVLLAYPFWDGMVGSWPPSPVAHWLMMANPFILAFLPYLHPNAVAWPDYAVFFTTTLGISIVLAGLSIWTARPSAVRTRDRQERAPRLSAIGRIMRRLPGPSLDRDPVLWREWHRTRTPRMSVLLLLLVGSMTLACAIKAYVLWYGEAGGGLSNSPEVDLYPYLFQVPFGLLVLSAVAPMSLSEERQRGSLDVLMATPLSTWEIVRGKWLSVYRLVPWLAIGPGLMGLSLALSPTLMERHSKSSDGLSESERLYASALLVVTILAHGAAISSLGLILATWVRRQARAIAISVTVFVLIALGWPIMILGISGRWLLPREAATAALSPIFTVGSIAESLVRPASLTRGWLWGAMLWDPGIIVVAVGLLLLTVWTFERCLERMPERSSPKPRNPARTLSRRSGFPG